MGYSEDFIPDGMNAFERNVKRIGDCIVAAVLMIVFSPLFLICYIAVKREDGGAAIFKQERIGRFGRPFYIYKFRSMRLDAESMGPQLYAGGRDVRLTKIGRFLREHHLDELPQLWNVFCGDMAFIGPRPERKFYIDQIIKQDPRYQCIRFVPERLHMQLCIMVTRIRWTRCYAVCGMTCFICNIARGGLTLKY